MLSEELFFLSEKSFGFIISIFWNFKVFFHFEVEVSVDWNHSEAWILFVKYQKSVIRLVKIVVRQKLLHSFTLEFKFGLNITSICCWILSEISVPLSLVRIRLLFFKYKSTCFFGAYKKLIFLDFQVWSGCSKRIIYLLRNVLNFLLNFFFLNIFG